MIKKNYKKPSMTVVELNHKIQLLAGTNINGGESDDAPPNTSVEDLWEH